jgi:hypothetical protein
LKDRSDQLLAAAGKSPQEENGITIKAFAINQRVAPREEGLE